ncbi:MAG: glutamate 5-kinase [Culicoidibacterales bacterium]
MNKKRIVIKIGSSSLIDQNDMNRQFISSIAFEVKQLQEMQHEVIIVTSGAVAAARMTLPNEREQSLSGKQALSAIGQARLVHIYDEIFAHQNMITAQILLTNDDFKSKKRMLNFRNTLEQLFQLGAIPIINENDALSSEEIQVGDNDTLGSLVAVATNANHYIILSDIEGLYNENPMNNPNAKLIPIVSDITDEIRNMASGSGSSFGTGGMRTKISAAEIATEAGVDVSIAKANVEKLAQKLLNREPIGTTFIKKDIVRTHNHWIGFHSLPSGKIIVDTGAASAIRNRKSLLAVGIVSVKGDFHIGDTVEIFDMENCLIGRGLSNFDSAEIRLIQGKTTEQHKDILGLLTHTSVIHANNLVLK